MATTKLDLHGQAKFPSQLIQQQTAGELTGRQMFRHGPFQDAQCPAPGRAAPHGLHGLVAVADGGLQSVVLHGVQLPQHLWPGATCAWANPPPGGQICI